MNWPVILLVLGAYILGAIPFGLLIARATAGIDITKVGSGNIGATNVHRVLGWKVGVPVMILDIGKGLIPPLIARGLALSWEPNLSITDVALIAGIAAVLGHCASPFLKFKGGKGIATICGAALGATPLIALIGISAFLVAAIATRYISVASIVAVIAVTVASVLLPNDALVIGCFFLVCVFIMSKHRANVRRLLKGEEPKISLKGGRGVPKDDPETAADGEGKDENKSNNG